MMPFSNHNPQNQRKSIDNQILTIMLKSPKPKKFNIHTQDVKDGPVTALQIWLFLLKILINRLNCGLRLPKLVNFVYVHKGPFIKKRALQEKIYKCRFARTTCGYQTATKSCK